MPLKRDIVSNEQQQEAMADRHIVVYTGALQPGVELEQVVSAFSVRFGIPPQHVREMLATGGETTIKSGLDARESLEYRQTLERIGLIVRIDPPLAEEDAAGVDPSSFDPPGNPGAGRDNPHPPDGFHEPHRMPAGHGWLWLKRGFSMVFAYPVHWIGALLIWIVVNFAMNLIPVVNVLSALSAAVFMGGIMLGAHEQENGIGFRIERLFAGFSNRFGALFLVGLFYMLGFIVVLLFMLVSLGGFFSLAPGVWSGSATGLPPEPMLNPLTWLPVLLVFALVVPLVMAYWFAPALVILDRASPLRAMVMSFRACLRNILPFIVYGLVSIVLFILGAIPLLLGLLIVIPAVVASVYAAYRDIFR